MHSLAVNGVHTVCGEAVTQDDLAPAVEGDPDTVITTYQVGHHGELLQCRFVVLHEVLLCVQTNKVSATPTPHRTLMVHPTGDGCLVSVRMVHHLGDNGLGLQQVFPSVIWRDKHSNPSAAHPHDDSGATAGGVLGEDAEGLAREGLGGDVSGGERGELEGKHQVCVLRSKERFTSCDRHAADSLSLVRDGQLPHLPTPWSELNNVVRGLPHGQHHVSTLTVHGLGHGSRDEEVGLRKPSRTDQQATADPLG